MAYDINWLIPGRVIELSLFGNVTDDDLIAMNAELTQSVGKLIGKSKLHVIYNGSNIEQPYLNLERAAQVMTIYRDEQVGWFVLTGKMSPVVHFLTTSFAAKVKLSLASAQDRDEALDLLLNHDSSLAADLIKSLAS